MLSNPSVMPHAPVCSAGDHLQVFLPAVPILLNLDPCIALWLPSIWLVGPVAWCSRGTLRAMQGSNLQMRPLLRENLKSAGNTDFRPPARHANLTTLRCSRTVLSTDELHMLLPNVSRRCGGSRMKT